MYFLLITCITSTESLSRCIPRTPDQLNETLAFQPPSLDLHRGHRFRGKVPIRISRLALASDTSSAGFARVDGLPQRGAYGSVVSRKGGARGGRMLFDARPENALPFRHRSLPVSHLQYPSWKLLGNPEMSSMEGS